MVQTPDKDIAAYEAMRKDLEKTHKGGWALVGEQKLAGTYPGLEEALEAAEEKFGDGLCHIRLIGEELDDCGSVLFFDHFPCGS